MLLSICYLKVFYLQLTFQNVVGFSISTGDQQKPLPASIPGHTKSCHYLFIIFPVLPTKRGTDAVYCHVFFTLVNRCTSCFCFVVMSHTITAQDQSPEQMNSLYWAEYFIRLHSMSFWLSISHYIRATCLTRISDWSIYCTYIYECLHRNINIRLLILRQTVLLRISIPSLLSYWSVYVYMHIFIKLFTLLHVYCKCEAKLENTCTWPLLIIHKTSRLFCSFVIHCQAKQDKQATKYIDLGLNAHMDYSSFFHPLPSQMSQMRH